MKVKIISVFPVETLDATSNEPKPIATILGVQVKHEYNNPCLFLKDISLDKIAQEEIEEIEKKLKQRELDIEIEKKPNKDDVSIEELTELVTQHVKQILSS
jgi:hypothetical protein